MLKRAFITVLRGAASQATYDLDPSQPVRIGRGSACQIQVSDPLSSRTHVVLTFEGGRWYASDAGSSNGTLLNNARIKQQVGLEDGDTIRIGSTDLEFHWVDSSENERDAALLNQTLIMEMPISAEDSYNGTMEQVYSRRRMQDFMDLFQLSLCLLRCTTPEEVSEFGIEILRVHTGADLAGILWVDEQGRLKPQKAALAEGAGNIRLSRKLTDRVVQQARAVWAKEEAASKGGKNEFSDAICVPLMRATEVIGAVHLYREHGEFEQQHFDFSISAAAMLGSALLATRTRVSLRADHRRLLERNADAVEMLGDCAPMKVLKDRIRRVANASGCVLVRGESGVGKELVARAIHRHSPRSDRPLLCVNCAAIPMELMESQLFGHRKGAFTGAERDHMGWFEQAHTGTLFLDEVGEMTLDGQAKLLRILEGHPFLPVGAIQEVSVDVRIIAATNRDLADYVREKKFREDLYYRLSVFEMVVPPLRQRGEDINLLVEHFLQHFSAIHGRPNMSLSSAARKQLLEYSWPGNVRQLRNVIDSAVVLAASDEIEPQDLALRDVVGDRLDSLRLDVWEERLIREALKRTGSNVPESAGLLGISRATLYRKLEQYNLQQ